MGTERRSGATKVLGGTRVALALGALVGFATAMTGVAMLSVPAAMIIGGGAVFAICLFVDVDRG